jgi:serine O-acetyltransferase
MRLFTTFNQFTRSVGADFHRFTAHSRALRGGASAGFRDTLETWFFKAGFQAVFLYRLSHWCVQNKLLFLARFLTRLNLAITGADIGFAAEIGKGLLIGHPVGIVVGHRTKIGENATILGGVLFGVKSWAPDVVGQLPEAGRNCVFCARASILGNCKLGDFVVVGINAVVDVDVPSDAFAGGAPIEIVPHRGKELISGWCL